MPGADIRRFSRDRRGLALNFFTGITSSALHVLADTLINPILVLALFVALLTDSYVLIGLVPAVSAAAWYMPQLFAAAIVTGRRRKLPWATGSNIVRTAAITLLAYVGFRADQLSDEQLLRSFFICYVAYNLAAGFANVPMTDVIAKAVPGERRGTFVTQRNLWGGLLAFLAGLIIARVLGDDGPAFPRNFSLLFIAAAATLTASTFFQARMREPLGASAVRRAPLVESLRRGPRALADPNYRRFLLFRGTLSLSAIADPFYVVYAVRELNTPASFVGVYIAAVVLARLGSSFMWTSLSARRGDKSVLQAAALVRLLLPLTALTLPYIAGTSLYQDNVTNERVLFYAFGLIFVAYGAALSAQIRGGFSYLLDIAPSDSRPSYIGFTNTLLAAVAFAPLIGALLIDRYGFDGVFLAASFIGLAAVFVSGALTDTYVQTRRTAEAWRLRRARS